MKDFYVFIIERERLSDDDGYVSWSPVGEVVRASDGPSAIEAIKDGLGSSLVAAVPVDDITFAETEVSQVTSVAQVDLSGPADAVVYEPDAEPVS